VEMPPPEGVQLWGANPPPTSVQARFVENEDWQTRGPWQIRKVFGSDKEEALRTRLASRVDASADEIALTRNTTEALSNVIFGLYLARGDNRHGKTD
jgi:hypothetical protein